MAEILIATIMRPAGDTGVQTHFCTFRDWLVTQGDTVETITPYAAPKWLVYPLFAVRRLIDSLHGGLSVWWYRYWHMMMLRLALRRALRKASPCVIYAQCPLSASAALAARRNALQKVVMVVHFNVSQADEWAGKGRIAVDGQSARNIRNFESWILPRLDGLVFVSAFMRETLLARIPGLAGVPYAVIPNFVADPGEPARTCEVMGDLLTVGTLEPRKNQSYAIDIIAAARDAGVVLRLALAGDGPDLAVLEGYARAQGVAEQVSFLGFVRNAAQLFPSYRACLHVAKIENLPVTIIEAMARGLPVLAAPVGGVPELFSDGVEGRYLPLDNAALAARYVIEVLSDEVVCEQFGQASRSRFVATFRNEVAAASLLAFLERIACSHAS